MKTKLETMAKDLIAAHNLTGWTFFWMNRKRALGVCDYTRKRIGLSWPLAQVNTTETMRQTLLHEVAHALTPGASHGPQWQRMALNLGCDEARAATAKAVSAPAPYILQCTACGKTLRNVHRRSAALLRRRHTACPAGAQFGDVRFVKS